MIDTATDTASEQRHNATQANSAAPADDQNRGKQAMPSRPKPEDDFVAKPVARTEQQDQRSYQISQIKTRFSAQEETGGNGTTILRFGMPPSDPDFPFDIRTLDCVLSVPLEQNRSLVPALRITNSEMERGYQLNVENGFRALWGQQQRPTLLNTMKLLDRQLETLLTAQKAEVIKLISNAGPAPVAPTRTAPAQLAPPQRSATATAQQARKQSMPSIQRVEEARSKRAAETQNLEHRLGRHPTFAKEASGTMYTLAVEPRKRQELPPELQAIKSIRLFVPEQYDIEACSIEMLGVEGDASKNAEMAFARRAEEKKDTTLMAHVNHFAQNLHIMAAEKPPSIAPTQPPVTPRDDELNLPATQGVDTVHPHDTDKSHVKIISRPPEWDTGHHPADEDDSDDDHDEDDSVTDASDADDDEPGAEIEQGAVRAIPDASARNTGILVSLPDLQLYNIELLELTSLSLTVKCNRCREGHDIHALKPIPLDSAPATTTPNTSRSILCKKCSQPLSASFYSDLLHASSTHAAHLVLDNCEPLDMLPSSFTPTCATCSTTHPPPGISSVRGAADSLAICRGCHTRMLFKLPSVHFLRLGGASTTRNLPLKAPKAPKEKLGIIAGTELPDRGACTHYRKSHRWFRFSCCATVYPCDKCHDLSEAGRQHPQEFANRMICGWCSREQYYRPEDCGSCGKSLVGKRGRGFWEGGTGTRDPVKLSRKDPRKHKLATKLRKDRAKAKEKNERRC